MCSSRFFVAVFGLLIASLHWPSMVEASPTGYSTGVWNCPYQINMRTGAGTTFPSLFKQDCTGKVYILNGSEVYIKQDDGVVSTWVQVVNEAQLTGWVNKKFILITEAATYNRGLPNQTSVETNTQALPEYEPPEEDTFPPVTSVPPTQKLAVPVVASPTVTTPIPEKPTFIPVTSSSPPQTSVVATPPIVTGLPAQTQPTSESEDLVEVVATGMGIDANAALLNAYSNAVQQALGLYVDAETLVQNDQVVRDNILTYSKGFVEKADQVSINQVNGLFQATIRAKVKRQELMASVKANNIVSVQAIDGASIYGTIETPEQKKLKEQQQQNAQEILQKAVTKFASVDLLRVELVGEPSVETGETDTVLTYNVLFYMDEVAYKKAIKELMAVLDQIATKKTELLLETDALQRGDRNSPEFTFYVQRKGISYDLTYPILHVLTWHAKNFASVKVMEYSFENVKKEVFNGFKQSGYVAHLSLLDAQGEFLAGKQFNIGEPGTSIYFDTIEYINGILIKPFIDYGNGYKLKHLISVAITVANEDLPNLQSAKIELKR